MLERLDPPDVGCERRLPLIGHGELAIDADTELDPNRRVRIEVSPRERRRLQAERRLRLRLQARRTAISRAAYPPMWLLRRLRARDGA